MNKLLKVLLIGCSPFLLFSCLEDANETLILPDVVYATPIKQIIPAALLSEIEDYMPIYEGIIPPDIEGVYLVTPQTLVYTSDNSFTIGHVFSDNVIKFSNQNGTTNIVTFASKESNSEDSSELVSISGTNQNFTAYFITTGISQGISTKMSTVISGTISNGGILNYKMAFIMLEKGNDPKGKLMNVNAYRIVKDGDGLASNTSWVTASKIKSFGSKMIQNLSKYSATNPVKIQSNEK